MYGITRKIFRQHRMLIIVTLENAINESLAAERDSTESLVVDILQPDFLHIIDDESNVETITASQQALSSNEYSIESGGEAGDFSAPGLQEINRKGSSEVSKQATSEATRSVPNQREDKILPALYRLF